MNTPLTPYDIARRFANGFADSRLIADWTQRNFDKAFHIQIGADMRRPPSADDAPFIAIFPDSCKTGPQRASVTSEIGLVVGISESEWSESEKGIFEMRGLSLLAELTPLLEAAMRDALPKARLQEVEVEAEITEYPLCMAFISVTIEEPLPIGRRLS